MSPTIWVSDRDAGIRALFREVVPEAEILDPRELEARLLRGQRPDGLVVDGTQYMELPPHVRAAVSQLPRVLVCTGLLLASMPLKLVSGPGIAVLGKPFGADDLERAVEWVRESRSGGRAAPTGAGRVHAIPAPSVGARQGPASAPPS